MRKTLTALVIAGASLFPQVSKGAEYDFYMPGETSLQEIFDNAQSGDVFNLLPNIGHGNWVNANSTLNNKNITLNVQGNGYIGEINLNGNSELTINSIKDNQIGESFYVHFKVIDSSSLSLNDSEFDWGVNNSRIIDFNSNGNLIITKSIIRGEINLEKLVGNVSISQTVFGNYPNPINFQEGFYEGENSELNILNNTFVNIDNAIYLGSPLINTSGYIVNNLRYDRHGNFGALVNNRDYLGDNISVSNNLTTDNFADFFKYPINGGGRYIEGVTTWFPDRDTTWVGAISPEPSSLVVLGSTLPLLMRRGKSKEEHLPKAF